LLPVENPGFIFVRRVLQPWKKTTSVCTKKKGSSSSKPSSTTSSRRHSVSESPRSTEEDTAPPRRNHSSPLWHESHTKLVYEVHRFSRTHGGAARPTSPLDTIIRSTSIRSAVFQVGFIIMTEEEEEKLARLM
jgi:hypothetical protein